MAQAKLRIDALRKVGSKVVVEYSSTIGALPGSPIGHGMSWQTVGDFRAFLLQVRDFLRKPETLLALTLLARIQADPNITTPQAYVGKVLTFDDTDLVNIIGIV